MWLGDLNNALKYGVAAADLGHIFGVNVQAMVHLRLGEFEKAIEFAEQFNVLVNNPGFKLYVEASIDAEKKPLFLEALAELETNLPISVVISSYVDMDRIDDAYRLADQITDHFFPNATWSFWRPGMKAFRNDPRFEELVTELKLMDYWREHGWPDACKPMGESLSCE